MESPTAVRESRRSRATVRVVLTGVCVAALIPLVAPQADAAVVLTGLSVSPASVQGGTSAVGTVSVFITFTPPITGTVNLASSNTAVAQVPASIVVSPVPASRKFTITTSVVATATSVTITATRGSVTRTASLGVTPAPPPNAPPVFAASSACGATVMFRLLQGTTHTVAASDDPAQSVALTTSSTPGWLTFSASNGNPATATLTSSLFAGGLQGIIDAIVGNSDTVSIDATDNGTPTQVATCDIEVRPSLF